MLLTHHPRDTATPPTLTWNTAVEGTETGTPLFHNPHHHRTGDPAESQSSAPVIVHVVPDPFVHDIAPCPAVGPVVAPATAALNKMLAAEDPVPVITLPGVPADGAFDVRCMNIGGTGAFVPVHVTVPRLTFSRYVAADPARFVIVAPSSGSCVQGQGWRDDYDWFIHWRAS